MIAVDGDIVLSGGSASANGIASPGAHKTVLGGNFDAMLVRIDPSGKRLWGTYFGGSNEDNAVHTAVDLSGAVYLAGYTRSFEGVATPGSFQGMLNGAGDTFLAKFSGTGELLWATYFGGEDGYEAITAVVTTSDGVYVAGSTWSATGIATDGAHQTVYGGGLGDGFVAKFSSDGDRIWATYFGGEASEESLSLVEASDHLYFCSHTTSKQGIGTEMSHQSEHADDQSGWDVMVGCFDKGGALEWASYYGGEGSDLCYAIKANSLGEIYIVGSTTSHAGIATPGAHKEALVEGSTDGFIAKFEPTGVRQWGTYYGGGGAETIYGADLSADDSVYVTGTTLSKDGIATDNAEHPEPLGSIDGFLAKLGGDGQIMWATYLGGSGIDNPYDVVSTPASLYVYGITDSPDGIASEDAHQPLPGGDYDAFLIKYAKGAGTPCTSPQDCESLSCEGGLCCDVACGNNLEDCQTCNKALGAQQDGVCTVLAGGVCRPAQGVCDADELCPGDSPLCPVDLFVADGTICETGECKAGICTPEWDSTSTSSEAPTSGATGGDAPTTSNGTGGQPSTTSDGSGSDTDVLPTTSAPGGPTGGENSSTSRGSPDTASDSVGSSDESGGCHCSAPALAVKVDPTLCLLVALGMGRRRRAVSA